MQKLSVLSFVALGLLGFANAHPQAPLYPRGPGTQNKLVEGKRAFYEQCDSSQIKTIEKAVAQ